MIHQAASIASSALLVTAVAAIAGTILPNLSAIVAALKGE